MNNAVHSTVENAVYLERVCSLPVCLIQFVTGT